MDAIRSRRSARCTIMSTTPCSRRNSLRWKPSGSVSRTVCSITRGPRESDEGVRLRDVDVAEHRETGRNTAGRRIGQHRHVGHSRLREGARGPRSSWPSGTGSRGPPASGRRRLPRSTRGGSAWSRLSLRPPHEALADHRAHRTAEKREFERRKPRPAGRGPARSSRPGRRSPRSTCGRRSAGPGIGVYPGTGGDPSAITSAPISSRGSRSRNWSSLRRAATRM